MRHDARGATLAELLVGAGLGLVILALLTAAVAVGSRLARAAGARGEAEDTAQLAVEAFLFDVRRAGFDPAGVGVVALSEALPDRVELAADLDGDGIVDAASEEVTAHVCATGLGRLSRIIGRQSMPLADGVTACTFRYLDAAGVPLPLPPAGLPAAGRALVRAVAFDLVLTPSGLAGRAERHVTAALRSLP